MEQYKNPQVDQFIQAVETFGSLNNYYRNVEISCQSQASKEIFISFEAELWPCCWVSHTKYAVYNHTYRPQMLALIEKYGKGFNSLRTQSVKDAIERDWFREDLTKVFPVPKGWTYALTNAVKLSIQQVRSTFSRICNRKKLEKPGSLTKNLRFPVSLG